MGLSVTPNVMDHNIVKFWAKPDTAKVRARRLHNRLSDDEPRHHTTYEMLLEEAHDEIIELLADVEETLPGIALANGPLLHDLSLKMINRLPEDDPRKADLKVLWEQGKEVEAIFIIAEQLIYDRYTLEENK